MTARTVADGSDFALVCDGCGRTAANLAASMHSWDLAWRLLRHHGWRGLAVATGPHTCPDCAHCRTDAG